MGDRKLSDNPSLVWIGLGKQTKDHQEGPAATWRWLSEVLAELPSPLFVENAERRRADTYLEGLIAYEARRHADVMVP